jgi:hypothetical protein
MKRFFLFIIFPFLGKAQFAPAAGQPGTSAIKKDSTIIVNWATGCKVTRGLQDISNPNSGLASFGDSTKAIGPADGVGVVSLGDGGSAVVTFQSPIKNGIGPDFCVFENAFDAGFLELGFVEVSSDGINYSRFPAVSNQQNTLQIGPFDNNADPTKLNNLAGKYMINYGTPFDLQELPVSPNLDINNITHVKIIDVVGCIQVQYATHDKNNNIINDLWATPFPSCGFDLDAVGVINQVPVSVKELQKPETIKIFPTVLDDELTILNFSNEVLVLEICDANGKNIFYQTIRDKQTILPVKELNAGIYFLRMRSDKVLFTEKLIKTN